LDAPVEADRIINRMLELNKSSASAYRQHGAYLQWVEHLERPQPDSERGKKLAETISSDVARALELAPDDAESIGMAGQYAYQRRDFEQAQKLFERGIKLYPTKGGMY